VTTEAWTFTDEERASADWYQWMLDLELEDKGGDVAELVWVRVG
jgi:hypothetical protein